MSKVLSFCGSLRKDSVNRKLLEIVAGLLKKAGHDYEEFDLRTNELPFYNQDLEDAGLPELVVKLKKQIESAEVILLASPEYNHSITGVLKNMIDWASRPFGKNSFDGKRVMIVGASPGKLGSARGQKHLREILEPLNVEIIGEPNEVCVANAYEAFDEENQLLDIVNFKQIEQLVLKI